VSGRLLVAGGGIAGLGAALAARRAGWHARVFEQAEAFGESGAGLQLGPNATRVLRDWGLLAAVTQVAAVPQRLVARDATDGRELGVLPLGKDAVARHGAPYLTLHRADLHAVLMAAAREREVPLQAAARVLDLEQDAHAVRLRLAGGTQALEGDALAAADGLWSTLRGQVLDDGPPVPSDHVAYRGLVEVSQLHARWRTPEVTAWLAPRMHAVTYPVRGGRALNVVCVVEEAVTGDRTGWDHPAAAERARAALSSACAPLRDVAQAVASWGLWVLHDRAPVASADQMARGRVALLGDAAHPMRPYLAQGAAMALEDAHELGRLLGESQGPAVDVPLVLGRYALNRWQRCARVQRRSWRNGVIFHAAGPTRVARNLAMRVLGRGLMDLPWLYGR
jgi:salicylate hydroxylase